MIDLAFEEKDVKNTHTFELTCEAESGSPFVMDENDEFLNVASPADMALLPDTPGGSLYRTDEITLIFRDIYTREYTRENVSAQVAQLNEITLSDLSDVILFSNIVP